MVAVSVVISTWNRLSYLQQCVKSILQQDFNDIELIIVDNCSHDGTQEYLQALNFNFPYKYRIMDTTDNSAICTLNIGFKMAVGKFILVLDDDVIMQQPNTISALYNDALTHDAKLVAANVVTPQEMIHQLEFKQQIDVIPGHPFRVYDFIGACALIDRFCFSYIDYYDESFDIYWNEADTALKFLCNNWEVLYEPKITPIHYISQQSRNLSRGWLYYVQNGNIIINRYLPLKYRAYLIPIRSALLFKEGLFWFRDSQVTLKLVKIILRSMYDMIHMPRIRALDPIMQYNIEQNYKTWHIKKFKEWLHVYFTN